VKRSAAPPLRVNIGTLSLSGMTQRQGERIGVALQSELSRLLSNDNALRSLREAAASGSLITTESLSAGRLRMNPRERPERTGQRLAQQLVKRLTTAPTHTADETGLRK